MMIVWRRLVQICLDDEFAFRGSRLNIESLRSRVGPKIDEGF